MSTVKPVPNVGVCATCPWRKSNHGKPHPANWYRESNLRRLWNGIRRGQARGMVCHSTDPEAADYGSTKPVPETAQPRECGGALVLVIREVEVLNGCQNFAEYRMKRGKDGMTRPALRQWLNRYVFGAMEGRPIPTVTADDLDGIGLP